MVSAYFNHSISLPLSPNHKKASHHVRSVSLPCRSHSHISHLEEQICVVRSCATIPHQATSSSIESIFVEIEALQIALDDFLNLTQTQETLRGSISTNFLLENVLILSDIYGSFISTIVNLKQHQSEVRSAIRRADKISLASCLRSQRCAEKEISQLASRLKSTTKCKPAGLALNATEAEIIGILIEAISVTSSASMMVFNGVIAMLASAPTMKNCNSLQMVKKFSALNFSIKAGRLDELDISIRNIEECCERLFRNLINSRVSLLNINSSVFVKTT